MCACVYLIHTSVIKFMKKFHVFLIFWTSIIFLRFPKSAITCKIQKCLRFINYIINTPSIGESWFVSLMSNCVESFFLLTSWLKKKFNMNSMEWKGYPMALKVFPRYCHPQPVFSRDPNGGIKCSVDTNSKLVVLCFIEAVQSPRVQTWAD